MQFLIRPLALFILLSSYLNLGAQAATALGFDGTNDVVASPTLSTTITNKTFSAWVKLNNISQTGGGLISLQTTGGGTFDAIVYNETSQGWGFGSNGFARTAWSGVTETSTTQWVHIAATYSANDYRLYRNGVLILQTTAFGITSFPSGGCQVLVGQRHTGGSNAWLNASIDDVNVWNRALSQSEIQTSMGCQLSSAAPGLLIHYTLNNGTVGANNAGLTTATDISGNANTGTLSNFALTGTTSNWVAGTVTTTCSSIMGNTNLCLGGTSDLFVPGENDWTLPTGGTITTNGNDYIHSFTSTGTFTTTQAISNAKVLVVAGGGGGGNRHAGGGGAGGYVSNTAFNISSGAITATVGAGGAGANVTTLSGANGGNSTFSTLTAIGGGGGGSNDTNGNTGGSGGGGSNGHTGGAGTAGQGNAGGTHVACCYPYGAGGGGAGAAALTVSGSQGSAGGVGLSNSITGTSVFYAGGGGGGADAASGYAGGVGGGGTGGNNIALNGSNGTANTGGGGGGGGATVSTSGNGGNGGSGIVIVRYTAPKWTSSNAAVATVNAQTGLITAVSAGTSTITYTSATGVASTTTVTVSAAAPSFTTCPTNTTQSNTANSCSATVNYTAVANNGGTITYRFTGATIGTGSGTGSGSTFNSGVTNVTLTATNGCGMATCSFTVTVNDTQAPSFIPYAAPTLALSNVSEASQYSLVYALDIPNGSDWNAPADIPYLTNNATALAGVPFNRIAYMLQLDGQWVWVSMDAFTSNVSLTGIPTGTTRFQQTVNNMNVFASAGAPVTTGSGITTGNIELWADCYTQAAGLAGIGGNSGNFDINDTPDGTLNCYGSFQVHNWGAQQTLLAYNSWTTNNTSVGIGSWNFGDPDWTFANNGASFTTKKLYVLIRPTSSVAFTPTNIVQNTALNSCTQTVTYSLSASDNCSAPTITYSPNSGSSFPKGNSTVTATATDAAGNSTSTSFTVTINDTQAPTLACVANQTLSAAAGACSQTYIIVDPITDNCTGSTWGYTLTGATTGTVTGIADGTNSSAITFNRGVTTVTLSGTDGTNAAATCSFTVTVNDLTPPNMTCAANVSINTAAGTCTGTTTLTPPTVSDNCSILNNALNFDGINDNLTAPLLGSIPTQYTVEFWINPASRADFNQQIMIGGGWLGFTFHTTADGSVYVGTDISTRLTPTQLPANTVVLNTWQHFAYVFNAGSVSFYKNGVLLATTTQTNPSTFNQLNFSLVHGSIDEFRVWTTARTQAQIAATMNTQLTGTESNLVQYLNFNQGVPNGNNAGLTTVTDLATLGGNNSASITGFALNGNTSNWVLGNTGVTGGVNLTSNAPATYPKGNTTVTWTATDASGNSASCNQTVTVVDNQAPTLACVANQAFTTAAGTCTRTYTIIDPITDNCTGATWGYTLSGATTGTVTGIADGTNSSAVTFNKGVTTVTLTGTDGTNTATTCSFTVTVTDNQAPTLACVVNQTLNTAAGACSQTYTITDPITDNCTSATWGYTLTGATTATVTGIADGTNSSAITFNRGVTTVTLTGTDGTNAATTCSFTVTVNDATPPTITCAANATINTNPGTCTGTTTLTAPTVTENCTLTNNNALNLDGAGNIVSANGINLANQSFTIEFWMKRSATSVDDYIIGQGITSNNQGLHIGFRATNEFAFAFFADDINIPATYSDLNWHHWACVYVAGGSQSVYRDGILVGSRVAMANYSGSGSFIIGGLPWGGYNSGGSIDELRIWNVARSATDISSNVNSSIAAQAGLLASYRFNQGIANGSNPGVTTLTDASGNNYNGTLSGFTLNGTTSNWIGGVPTITNYSLTNNAPAVFPKGNTTVTWTATDAAGNSASCNQTVTVVDNQAPTLACVANQTLTAAAGTCSQTYTIADPITDNCTGATWGYTLTGATTATVTGIADGTNSSAIAFNGGVTTVTLTGTDGTNAATTCSFTVTVTDNQAPTLACVANQTLNAAAGTCSQTYTIVDPITDNCTGATWGYTLTGATTATVTGIADGTNSSAITFNSGVTTVTLTGTDGTNAATTCSFIVTVNDVTPPSITCAANVTINTTAGLCTGTTTLVQPTVTDNCSNTNVLSFDGTNDYVSIPANTGINSRFASNRITVEAWIYLTSVPSGQPMIVGESIQADNRVTYCLNMSGQSIVGGMYSSGWTRVTSTATIPLNTWTHVASTYDQTDIKLYINGTLVGSLATSMPIPNGTEEWRIGRRWDLPEYFPGRIRDLRIWNITRTPAELASGMIGGVTTSTPGLVSWHTMNQGIGGGNNTGITTLNDGLSTYNGSLNNFALTGNNSNFIGSSIGTISNNAPTTYPKGNTTVTWTATDASGNSATCNQTVTVVDNQAPTLACVANQTLSAAAGTCSQTYTIADPITDNCTGSTWGYTLTGATTGSVTGIADGTNSSAITFNRGVTTVTLTGTDGTNAATTCNFTVTVNDVTPPSITCAANVSINTTAGTCTGTTTLTAPTVTESCTPTNNNALNLDGAGNLVTANGINLANQSFTIEFWMKRSATSVDDYIIGQGITSNNQGLHIGFRATNEFAFAFFADDINIPATYSDLNWHHWACVYVAGGSQSVYRDGILVGSRVALANYSGSGSFVIGGLPWGGYNSGGSIDELRIWNVARSATDISSNVNSSIASQAGLLASYRFNQGIANGSNPSVTTLTDASGNNYNGTLSGFTLNGTSSNWIGGVPTITGYSLSNNAPATYPIGNTTVTWTATDAAGNSATCNQTVTVIDNIAPTITCAADVTINTTPGLCTGTTTLTAPTATDNCGVTGNALSFDGVNDNIDVTIDANEAAYTAELWFKTTNANCGIMQHDGTINGSGGGHDRHIYLTGGNIGVRLWANEVITTSGTNYADGNWHHIAYTFGTGVGAQRIYVDGVLKVTGTLSASAWNGNSINIGTSIDSPNYFSGLMDEVRIWNVARTQAQILANMNATISPSTSGLQAYYRFDQGVAGGNNTAITTATNNQGNAALNGNLMGFAMNGASSNFVASNSPVGGVVITNNAPTTYPIGNTTVTWTATDAAGNTATCNQIVTVVAPEINVTGNTVSILDADATPSATDHTDFGNVNLNASLTRTFTIQNTGTSSLTVSTITSTGTNASNFVVGGITLPATVAAGASTTFTVVFTATGIGTPTATITVNNSDCNEAAYDFAVQASVTCAPPVITISGTTTACNTVTLTASAPGATAYAWSGGSSTSTAANTFSTSGTYTVTVTGTVACTSSASSTVTVNASPAAPVVSPASITACQNEAINLTIPAAVGGVNYTWSPAGTLFTNSTGTTAYVAGNSATSLYAIVPNVVATYTVTATSAAGCTSTGSATVNTNFASSNVILAPSTSATGAHHLQTSCEDANWTYYENPSNPGKYLFAINWNPDGGAALNATQKALTLNPGATAFGVFIDNQSPVSGTAPMAASPGTYNTGNGTIGWYESTSTSTSQATFAMQRYWNVNVGGGMLPEPVNVRFYFDPNEYDAVVNAATAWSLANGGYVEAPKWFKTVGATDGINNSWNPGSDLDPITVEHSGWVMDLNPLVSGYGFDNGIRYVQFNSVPSFSGGGLTVGVGSGSALPLELLYFTGAKDNGVSHLSWATAMEMNTSHFVVERSRDGVNFAPIGQVAAAGNSNQELVYEFDDNTPMTGNNYYRLRMVDLDASYTYSNIINLTYDVNFGVDVFPNPFQSSVAVDIFTEQHSTSEATIELFDMLGRQVMNNTVSIGHGHNSFTLDNASLLTGTYTLKITSGANVVIRKIVKDGQ